MLETKVAAIVRQGCAEHDNYNLHLLRSHDGLNLCVNLWLAEQPKAILFYIHGIQSHAGWLFETAPYLAANGIHVVAMDRRGSGASEGMRGHSDSGDVILRDYYLAWQYAQSLAPELPITVLGQSFGGSILAALLCRYQISAQKVIFSAPALGQQRLRHEIYELNRLRAMRGEEYRLLALRDNEYSSDNKYLRFIANDSQINRSVTQSMVAALIEIEDIYFDNKVCLERIAAPIHFIEPENDSIINMEVSREVLTRFLSVKRHVINTQNHYMEFSNKRYRLWKTIIHICTNKENSLD